MNPVGLSYISLLPQKLFYTLLPVFFPTRRNVETFMNRMVFTPEEKPEGELWRQLADYIEISVKDFEFGGDYPTKLADAEIVRLKAETHLIVGENDALIPQHKTVKRARKLLPNLKSVDVLPNIGHGIELSSSAIEKLKAVLET
ncbi:MAG: alpha/beta hydrolase [Pyrinomonadaceae bacterium]